jgi:DNA-binding transcriptional regulator YiaG
MGMSEQHIRAAELLREHAPFNGRTISQRDTSKEDSSGGAATAQPTHAHKNKSSDDSLSALNVRRMREDSKLTQEDFWGRVGITQSGGSRYEHGRIIPEPVRILLSLAYGSITDRNDAFRVLLPECKVDIAWPRSSLQTISMLQPS